jgi:hypothetical protein
MTACAPMRASVIKVLSSARTFSPVASTCQQLVGRRGDVHLGPALSPPRQDVGRLEGHAHIHGGGCEDPPCGVPQPRRHDLGRVEDQLDVHAGTVTR